MTRTSSRPTRTTRTTTTTTTRTPVLVLVHRVDVPPPRSAPTSRARGRATYEMNAHARDVAIDRSIDRSTTSTRSIDRLDRRRWFHRQAVNGRDRVFARERELEVEVGDGWAMGVYPCGYYWFMTRQVRCVPTRVMSRDRSWARLERVRGGRARNGLWATADEDDG